MKKLLLVCCLALASYGCEKAPEKIEPKLKVLKLLSDDYGAFMESLFDAQKLRSDIMMEYLDSGRSFDTLPSSFRETFDKVDRLVSQISSLNVHKSYWVESFESGCIESANYAYDWYMKVLSLHLNLESNLKNAVELQLRYLDQVENNPNFKAIAKKNLKLVLRYIEKLEENYNANLQAN